MTATFGERVRAQLREELIDAAAGMVVDGGWQQLRMQAIAERVGVSRRTVYNEFGTKARLAEALIMRVTERFLDDVHAVLVATPDLTTSWHDAVHCALRAADEDPLLGTVLAGVDSAEFLPLLTSEGGAVIERATHRLTRAARERWPDLPERPTRLAAEATVRLTLSHIVRPGAGIERAATDIAELATGYLRSADPGA
ncbi:TetR/AcrR family transcriptional regulator [Pseudonocardia sp. C8]|uniref:TetR/AcrR family transcriptional regulator n=1 Tax=Pseudonocardia sp. C8 TaxID=2762759 RepID=UPI0016425E4E|nr:TetR family transcriptional regulator [Pseudonocardia sp. C8]MBC3191093.1 TetR/AcrR family transcriptional regulator [Pseudonocardia sp. C8]